MGKKVNQPKGYRWKPVAVLVLVGMLLGATWAMEQTGNYSFINEEEKFNKQISLTAIIPHLNLTYANSKIKRRELIALTDAYRSTVSGITTTITALTTYTVKVTAKDSSGNLIGHGGDKFWIQIYNK